jgi:hypothetical protein
MLRAAVLGHWQNANIANARRTWVDQQRNNELTYQTTGSSGETQLSRTTIEPEQKRNNSTKTEL